jgi:hypothetical protein
MPNPQAQPIILSTRQQALLEQIAISHWTPSELAEEGKRITRQRYSFSQHR